MLYDKKYKPNLSKNSNDSSASLYEARKFFKEATLNYIKNNNPQKIPFSNIYSEHSFYGVLDNAGDVISPKIDTNMSFFDIVGQKDDGENLYLQNFVAAALSDMKKALREQILLCIPSGYGQNAADLMRNSPFFNFKVHYAFTKNIALDNYYLYKANAVGASFKTNTATNNKISSSIKNVKIFMKEFINYIVINNLGPITNSRIHCNNSFSNFNTGLSFSISDEDPGDDEKKFDKFYNDIGFSAFCKTCINFGFMIDKNIPYILTADLASPFMRKYWQKDEIQTIPSLLEQRYYKIFTTDLFRLQMFFWVAYSQYRQDNLYTPLDLLNSCSRDIYNYLTNIDAYERPNYSFFEFMSSFDEKYWIRLYIYFKIIDMNLEYSQKKFESLVDNAYKYIFPTNSPNLSDRYKYVIDFINKNFDETKGNYYFDYLHGRLRVLEDEAAVSGTDKIIF